MKNVRRDVFVILFFALISFLAKADDGKFESTYPRDNTFCSLDGKRIEVKLKGYDKFTQPSEAAYGEEVFIINSGNNAISVKENNFGRYRLLKGKNEYCSKVLAIRLNPSELAIFLQKDNRPLGHSLSVLYYNFITNDFELIDTKVNVTESVVTGNHLLLKTLPDPCKKQSGTVKIENQQYIYTVNDSSMWLSFDGRNFKTDRTRTFKSHEASEFYKDEEEFSRALGMSHTYTLAVSHTSNKKCIRFGEFDSWKCIGWRKMP